MLKKLTATALFIFCFSLIYSQDILVFKKKKQTIKNYWKGSTIAFQLQNGDWQKGEITRIKNDSFQIIPTAILFTPIGVDTIRFPLEKYSIKDIYALPKEGVVVDYQRGYFDISSTGGTNYGAFIANGLIFRIGAAGYATLNIANSFILDGGLTNENVKPLTTAAGVFAFGLLLKSLYKQTIKLGRKHHLETVKLSK